MTKGANRPPAGQSWIWITRDLIGSDAWRSMTGSTRRFVDFLMLENMRQGGKKNGQLVAPHRQLETWGIGTNQVSGAIGQAEELGLVEVFRGGMRVATRFALSWLPSADGAPPSDRWRGYSNPALTPLTSPKSGNLPSKQRAGLPSERRADDPNLPSEQRADDPESLPSKRRALIRSSCHTEASISEGTGEARGCRAGCAFDAQAVAA